MSNIYKTYRGKGRNHIRFVMTMPNGHKIDFKHGAIPSPVDHCIGGSYTTNNVDEQNFIEGHRFFRAGGIIIVKTETKAVKSGAKANISYTAVKGISKIIDAKNWLVENEVVRGSEELLSLGQKDFVNRSLALGYNFPDVSAFKQAEALEEVATSKPTTKAKEKKEKAKTEETTKEDDTKTAPSTAEIADDEQGNEAPNTNTVGGDEEPVEIEDPTTLAEAKAYLAKEEVFEAESIKRLSYDSFMKKAADKGFVFPNVKP